MIGRSRTRVAAWLCLWAALVVYLGLPGAHVLVHGLEARASAGVREGVDGRGRRVWVLPSPVVRATAAQRLVPVGVVLAARAPSQGHRHDGGGPLHGGDSPEHLGAGLLAAGVAMAALPLVVVVVHEVGTPGAPSWPERTARSSSRSSRGPPLVEC